jgi:hypothetical protein
VRKLSMGMGGDCGEQCWLCGSATSDLHRHASPVPPMCREGMKTSEVWGQCPQLKASKIVGLLLQTG